MCLCKKDVVIYHSHCTKSERRAIIFHHPQSSKSSDTTGSCIEPSTYLHSYTTKFAKAKSHLEIDKINTSPFIGTPCCLTLCLLSMSEAMFVAALEPFAVPSRRRSSSSLSTLESFPTFSRLRSSSSPSPSRPSPQSQERFPPPSPNKTSYSSSSESLILPPSTSSSPSVSPSSTSRFSSVCLKEPLSNHTRVQNLVAGLATKGISVTEWGALLLGRLGVPIIFHVSF